MRNPPLNPVPLRPAQSAAGRGREHGVGGESVSLAHAPIVLDLALQVVAFIRVSSHLFHIGTCFNLLWLMELGAAAAPANPRITLNLESYSGIQEVIR